MVTSVGFVELLLWIFVLAAVSSADVQQVQQNLGQLQLNAGSPAGGAAVGAAAVGAAGGRGAEAGARPRLRRGALQYIASSLRPQGVVQVPGLFHILVRFTSWFTLVRLSLLNIGFHQYHFVNISQQYIMKKEETFA